MDFKTAKKEFFRELQEANNCLTKEELVAKLGKTTIRCCWTDHVDYLRRDKIITERQAYIWGQVI